MCKYCNFREWERLYKDSEYEAFIYKDILRKEVKINIYGERDCCGTLDIEFPINFCPICGSQFLQQRKS